jgi:hypothetical protein
MSDRLLRETNPPEGRIASPTPQYYNPVSDAWEKAEGMDGAVFGNDIFDIRGKSTDTKPTDRPVGATFFEEDTGDLYSWNGTTWTLRAEDLWSDL